MPIKIATSEQTPALGAAMYAAVAAGIYADTEGAKKAMGNGFDKTYLPINQTVVLQSQYATAETQFLRFRSYRTNGVLDVYD